MSVLCSCGTVTKNSSESVSSDKTGINAESLENSSDEKSINTELLENIGMTYAEINKKYGKPSDLVHVEGGPVYAFENGCAYYSFGGFDGIDWGYELSAGEGIPQVPSDEHGNWIFETAPFPKSESKCDSIWYIKAKDVFLNLTEALTASEIELSYPVKHLSTSFSEMHQITLSRFLFNDTYIAIENPDNSISPDSTILVIEFYE